MRPEVIQRLGLLLRNKSEETKKAYFFYIKKFLLYADDKDTYDEFDIREFCASLEEEGKSRSYINSAFSAVKLFLRAKKQALPLTSRDILPKEGEKEQPTMATEDIRKLIETVKIKGTEKQIFYLTLSTVWGPRQGEMVTCKENDIDKENKTIIIHTEKGGRVRKHLIPNIIFPIIANFSFNGISVSEINMMFKQICSMANVKRKPREGWHSPRRRLITELITRGVKREEVANFMRWKNTGGITQHRGRNDPTAMVDKYYHPEDKAVDLEIYKNHPFLPFWRNNA